MEQERIEQCSTYTVARWRQYSTHGAAQHSSSNRGIASSQFSSIQTLQGGGAHPVRQLQPHKVAATRLAKGQLRQVAAEALAEGAALSRQLGPHYGAEVPLHHARLQQGLHHA
jgi:hypothetical protein